MAIKIKPRLSFKDYFGFNPKELRKKYRREEVVLAMSLLAVEVQKAKIKQMAKPVDTKSAANFGFAEHHWAETRAALLKHLPARFRRRVKNWTEVDATIDYGRELDRCRSDDVQWDW